MIDTIKDPFVILSAKTKNLSSVETFKQNYALKEILKTSGLPFKMVSGRYGGEDEDSFLIPNISEKDALDIARLFSQECILVVDKNREAKLVFTDGSESENLGYFTNGESDDNFTIDAGIKYICTGAK